MRTLKLWIWPGLAAVGCLTALAVWFQAGLVEADLRTRAVAALRQDQSWAQVSLKGRDLTLSGLAPDEDSQARALEIARSVYGVRVATDASVLLPEESPYRLTAEKTANGVLLSGFVPNEPARAAIIARLTGMLPGIAVSDQMKLARGASDGLVELLGYGLTAFPWFSTGTVEITDASLRISGQALNPDDHEAALKALSAPPPSGGTLDSVKIEPAPAAGDYTWSASVGPGGITLSGYVPDAQTRASIVEAAKAIGPEWGVDDRMRFATGVPDGADWQAGTAQALSILADLAEGTVSIRGRVVDVSGQARDGAAFRSIETSLSDGMPGGLVPGTSDIGVAAVSPFEWTAKRDDDGLTLTGYIPSETVRARVLEIARLKFGALPVIDHQTIAAGAPDGFEEAALVSLQALSRLDRAEAGILDTTVFVRGAAFDEGASRDVTRLLSEQLPHGFSADPGIGLVPATEAVLPASDCQAELNRLAASNSVLFETGEARIQDHSFGFLDRIAFVARQCGQARLEISGHTDSDGAEAANLALSEQRARSVLDFMTAAGVPADRMVAVGYGESRPVESNDTDAGKAKNRRIEFRVLN